MTTFAPIMKTLSESSNPVQQQQLITTQQTPHQHVSTTPPSITTVDESWSQGRAGFGGLVAAMAIRESRKKLQEVHKERGDDTDNKKPLPPLRSMMVAFIQPVFVPGESEVSANVLRAGKSVTFIEAKVCQQGSVAATVQAAFGDARQTSVAVPHAHLEVTNARGGLPSRHDIPTFSFENSKFPLPRCLGHFEFKFVTGKPFDKASMHIKTLQMWIRMRSEDDADGNSSGDEPAEIFEGVSGDATATAPRVEEDVWATERLVALGDAVPPIAAYHYKRPPTASSLSWNFEIHRDPTTINLTSKRGTKGWFFLEYTLDIALDGYSQQSGVFYDEDGQIVASSRQCMTYFEPKQ